MRELLLRCLSADPAAWPTAAQVAEAAARALGAAMGASWLQRALSPSPPPTRPDGPLPRSRSAALQRWHRQMLGDAAAGAGGCADCGAEWARWGAVDFAVWVCHRCARLHRWLLPQSRLRPLGSEHWSPDGPGPTRAVKCP
jgi:hypothetical protein